MELRIGIMKNKELAEWFGITLKSFTNARKSKLEELTNFATFDVIRGGVDIKEVIRPTYIREIKKKQNLINEVFEEEWKGGNGNSLNTCSNVARQIKKDYDNKLQLKESTLEKYIRQTRKELYGVPFFEKGKKGSCRYLWAKAIMIDQVNHIYICEELTEREEQIKNDLLKKYFSANKDDIENKMDVKRMVESGEISKEQAYDLTCQIDGISENNFREFLTELKCEIGYPVMRVTELLK